MDLAPNVARYLAAAKALQHEAGKAGHVSERLGDLPRLTPELLDLLESEIASLALHQPPLAYKLAMLAEQVAWQQDNRRLQALAAFHLARAANAWLRPRRVWDAAARAQRLFLEIGEPGWAAAGAWQHYAVPWACNNYRLAAETLHQALLDLEAPEVEQWREECRLSLGFARNMLAQYDVALTHIRQSEQYYRSAADDAGLAQALTFKAGCLRRLSRFDEAEEAVSKALQLLAAMHRPLDLARADFQLGHILVIRGVDYARAEVVLQEGLHLFTSGDVTLWAAQCQNALARLFRETGRLAESRSAMQTARRTYRRFPILGLHADSLVDSAVFALRTGDAQKALGYLAEAQPLYRQLGVTFMAAWCDIYQGEAHAELGRYQLALRHLEKAYHDLRELGRSDGFAETALRLGEVWLWLDRPSHALAYLQEARPYFEQVGHTSFLAELYSVMTAARLRNGDDVSEIIEAAREALDRLDSHGVWPYLALLQRFIGEAYLEVGQAEVAIAHLRDAVDRFEHMGLHIEVAECCLPLGHCYRALASPQAALELWRRALDLSADSLPHISWRAHAGLARLVAEQGDSTQALVHYTAMVKAFARLRRWFWQPSLAGSFLQRSAPALDHAVAYAAARDTLLAIRFLEESKAQTVARRLSAGLEQQSAQMQADPGLRALADEVRWLQHEMNAARQSDAPAATWIDQQRKLVEKVRHYEARAARSERRAQGEEGAPLEDDFYLPAFRRAAGQQLGHRWLALDYYLAGDALVCAMIGDEDLATQHFALPLHAQRALDLLTRAGPTAGADLHDSLAQLARWLLPPHVLQNLRPDMTLIISPHRRLHRLPWAALPDEQGAPLVSRCTLLLTPSLHTFTLLQQRPVPTADRRHGCVVAVSEFGGRHTPLPETQQEAGALSALMGNGGLLLRQEQATWDALRALGSERNLPRRAFLHVASHAFYDAVTGRASGLALYDRDVWLDELWQLAPLPALVSLSACSAMQSYLYEGDEPIGLASTCLQAGAQNVVGSLWPIPDDSAAALTTSFYAHLFDGATPPRALALAQRQAIADGVAWRCWAPFICVGSA